MPRSLLPLVLAGSTLFACTTLGTGCRSASMFYDYPTPKMLGTDLDNLNRVQEENSEPSKFVVYEHEFKLVQYKEGKHVGGIRLNEAGEDHLKQIAESVRNGVSFPVVVERSHTSVQPGTQFEYPVHYNPELDNTRREVVVRALVAMGIPDADQRVVVAPAFAQSFHSSEAERAFYIGQQQRWGGSGLGGGFGGGFGGGLGAGFGGGGFF